MRLAALTGARAVLLAGPVALAFFAGGYFDGPRAWAGLLAWMMVAVGALALSHPLPRGRAPRVALAALALLAGWTLASLIWAPEAGPAYHDGQRVFLYLGVLLGAALLLRGRRVVAVVEPAVAGGALIVVGYGISERLLPAVLHFHHSPLAQGRLEQPLTYWNAMGEVAALGLVLCARLAGEPTRARRLRMTAAAAAAPLGLGLYLSVSRGSVFAGAAGLLALIVLVPTRAQARAVALVAAATIASSLAVAPLPAVTVLRGAHGTRVAQGLLALALLAVIAAAAAGGMRWLLTSEQGSATATRLPLPRHAPALALALVVGAFALFLAVGAKERVAQPLGTGASRLATLHSNRYAYWRVAWHAFESQPLRGVGGGGWAVYWLRHRPFAEGAQDAHSLYVQTAAELGLVGLALLGGFLGGVAGAARTAHARSPVLAAGPVAGVIVWAAHAAVDWDWEMPAATLPALLLAGTVLALAGVSVPESGYRIDPIGVRLRAAVRQRGAVSTGAALVGWGVAYAAGLALLAFGARGRFLLGAREYRYAWHRHQQTWLTERAVEIPIAMAALGEAGGAAVLEVGHVLGHYHAHEHEVVDKFEHAAGVRNLDVLALSAPEPYELIVCISTLEHVGFDDAPRDPSAAVAAVGHLRGLLAPGGRLLATVPVGYNQQLVRAIATGRAGFDEVLALRRERLGLRWREAPLDEVLELPYDRLLYRARAVLICTATG